MKGALLDLALSFHLMKVASSTDASQYTFVLCLHLQQCEHNASHGFHFVSFVVVIGKTESVHADDMSNIGKSFQKHLCWGDFV